MNVVRAGPVGAVTLVPADPRLAEPRARPDVAPVSVHCDEMIFSIVVCVMMKGKEKSTVGSNYERLGA